MHNIDVLSFVLIGIPCIICLLLGFVLGCSFTMGILKERKKHDNGI